MYCPIQLYAIQRLQMQLMSYTYFKSVTVAYLSGTHKWIIVVILTYPLPQVCLCRWANRVRRFRGDSSFNVLHSVFGGGLLSPIRRSHSAGTNPLPSETSDHHVIVRTPGTLLSHNETKRAAHISAYYHPCVQSVWAHAKHRSFNNDAQLRVCAWVQHGGAFLASVFLHGCLCVHMCAWVTLRGFTPAIIEQGLVDLI